MTEKRAWLYDLLFILVLLLAGYLRLGGANWGEGYHQHPDELFLSGVLDNLRAQTCNDPLVPIDACPPDQKRWLTVGEYFDTASSTLNPHNRGHAFFVYGNLPMTVVRYAMEMTDNVSNSKYFARQFSALADLFTIFILYLFVSKLYGRRVGLFAATFSAFAVMQIQQSHFFTSDLFVNLFMFLALYFAVGVIEHRRTENREHEIDISDRELEEQENPPKRITDYQLRITDFFRNPLFWLSIGFGFALGMAMASKINAAAMAIVLPGAFIVRYFLYDKNRRLNTAHWSIIAVFLIAGGLATIISFRIFQPYAFIGLGLNPQWVANISEQRVQASGEADLPWNLQWARRSHLYSFTNLTVWGLGLPLGILAWAGFLLMGWRIFKGEYKHLLLWCWTAFYFIWQSFQFNPTMRYQLPIYPLLCMMATWFIFELANWKVGTLKRSTTILASVIGVTVLVLTAIWAFAFQSIYLRDETRMAASRWIFQNIPGPINIHIQTEDGTYNQPLGFPTGTLIQADTPYIATFTPNVDGQVSGIELGHAMDSASSSTIVLTLFSSAAPDTVLGTASQVVDYFSTDDPRGPSVSFSFDQAIPVLKGQPYILKIETSGSGLALTGSSLANETDYDFGLPFRVDGYDPFGGMYRGDLIFQVYWDDNADKLNRFVETLNQSDYILIPTNHQYGQITRLPERFPLTTLYYRELLGCPAGEDIIHCYRVAQPGQYKGNLGFELVEVFESYPTFGPLVINDQAAEEAFTFYDHPKVLIFQKTKDFNLTEVSSLLSSVDLTNVVHLLPTNASDYKDLMLPDTRLAEQRAGGTWSDLFDYDWVQNKYPIVGVLVWYLFIFILGLVAYPIARLALPGIRQYAYPLGRIVGLVLIAWLSWMGGSIGIPYTRVSISVAFVIVAVTGFSLWMNRRDQFKEDWNSNRRFFVMVEILFFVFFLIDLLIRLGNSDMWHPAKGGERPMDFSYFNAVLKSTSFPPYDPWYAGGYINYYYYGFVLVGTPVKLLGIVPSIAYNFILPTWFALIAIGAFTVGWNLLDRGQKDEGNTSEIDVRLISGLAASFMTLLLGNLGTIRLLFNSFIRVAAPGGLVPVDANIIQKWGWAFKGIFLSIGGAQLPIGPGDWYWLPSRVIPAPNDVEPITEFPLFTFLYSDMHAHMIVMPLTLFIIAWAVSFIKSKAQMSLKEWIATFSIGALMVGALRPTNTWDLYTYFPLAALALAYTLYRNFAWKGRFNLPDWLGRALVAMGAVALLYILGSLLYSPFTHWYGQSYGAIDPWRGSHTPISSYITQWGLFLFIIVAWLAWETREWMASTPVSHLSKLREYALFIEIGIAVVVALMVFSAVDGVRAGLIALPLAAWAAILLLRPGMPDIKRGVLLMIGTALVLTLAVEVVVLVGDIGRMNTVFKLYLQAWILLAVSAAAAFGWLFNIFPFWRLRWRTIFQVGLYALFAGAFLFTITATTDKMTDRMNPLTPRTLDGITFMKYSQHWDGQPMELSEDYDAIRWLQDNVEGSPVIVEANCTEYRWCTRMTIYTGLPGIVGWNFHQRQQRGPASITVQQRVDEIGTFYTTIDIELARRFLKKYQVKYIIVGQLERNVYPALEGVPDGLAKFEQFEGEYWKTVYHDKHTTIYEVLP
ncbi:MAG: glycosyltransferase family 39 protein [Anaerolineales bacterium]|nr:glycosyltransferase family 39 protein [Anaerolineales bacterium]